ncbi:mitochondrial carrier [Sistotremastrum niveocremeum HHB9708]|uniref:Mitochondrial carrier n=1 Tax=Sistotremastrum niveocremeum HHB9708 TaxID=1314777 RepID=A0A164XPR2_9AGAM|nr:mitochondrial carrier [Sistotremastrum niveocremeum HHB9708]
MASTPGSLRDLYSSPPPDRTSWRFSPDPANPSQPATIPPISHPSSNWTPVVVNSPVLDASIIRDEHSVNANLVLKTVLASAIMQYTTSAIAMPWEVGKLLLQVQWVPNDTIEAEPEISGEESDTEEVDAELSDSSSETYFQEPPTASGSQLSLSRDSRRRRSQQLPTRPSRESRSLRAEYVIPIGPTDGVWGMIKRLGRSRNEGWSSLWKGLLTACVTDAMSSAIQPLIHNSLLSIIGPSPSNSHPLLIPVLSHLATGLILSPLDLIRTRLIAQSAIPAYKHYVGPVDALSQILREEGGFKGVYLHPHLLIPAILENTLRPLITLGFPSALGRLVFVSPDSHFAAWSCVEFLASCAGLLVTLPVETIRRRLQVQVRGAAKPLRTCVQTRPKPYNGVVDVFWRILSEERSEPPLVYTRLRKKGKQPEKNRDGWYSSTGLGQLYRGFGMGVGASAIVLVLAAIAGNDDRNMGWTEL